MEFIAKILEELSTKPEFGYFLLGVVVGMWLIRFILRRLFSIITVALLSLILGTGIIQSDNLLNVISKSIDVNLDLKQFQNNNKEDIKKL